MKSTVLINSLHPKWKPLTEKKSAAICVDLQKTFPELERKFTKNSNQSKLSVLRQLKSGELQAAIDIDGEFTTVALLPKASSSMMTIGVSRKSRLDKGNDVVGLKLALERAINKQVAGRYEEVIVKGDRKINLKRSAYVIYN